MPACELSRGVEARTAQPPLRPGHVTGNHPGLSVALIHHLLRRTFKVLFGYGMDTEQNPWQFIDPIRAIEASHQSRFQMTMEPFHDSVRLRLVRGFPVQTCVVQLGQSRPQF